jgi:hypothetical protein
VKLGIPFIVVSVEDEEVVQIFSIVILSAKYDQIAVEGVHGVSVARTWSHSFRLQLHPCELIHFGKVDLPDIVEVETILLILYLSIAL